MQIIHDYYNAFNRKDWEGMLQCLTETVRHEVNQGNTQVGKAAFRAFLQKMDDAYEERVLDLVVFTEASGARAAAEFVIDGIYKKAEEGLPPAHGQTYRLPVGAFFEIKEGKIDRVTNYYNLALWLSLVSK
jgi:steroid delta-isomerase-like uncharacterized protein